MEHLKAKFEELETNSKIKNIRDLYRGINDFKEGYQPRTNIVRDETGDLVTDYHSIMVRWRNHIFQFLNVLHMGLMKFGRQKYNQQDH